MNDRLLTLLLNQSGQILLLAVIFAFATRFIAKNRPHLAHAMWILVLIKCVTPPIWSSSFGVFSQLQILVDDETENSTPASEPSEFLPETTLPTANAEPLIVETFQGIEPAIDPLPEFDDSTSPQAEITLAEEPTVEASIEFVAETPTIEQAITTVAEIEIGPSSWPQRLLIFVAVGAMLTLLIIVDRCVRCLRLIQRHRTAEFDDALNERLQQLAKQLNIRRVPRIVVSNVLFGPAVLGLLRHTIVLPRCLLGRSFLPERTSQLAATCDQSMFQSEIRQTEITASNVVVPSCLPHSPQNEHVVPVLALRPFDLDRSLVAASCEVPLGQRDLQFLDPILAHELLHIRRGDLRFGMLQVIAQSLWWFHPAVWFANRWLSREAERCCDEQVIAELGCTPGQYARSLLAVIESKHTLQPIPVFPGMKPVEITTQRMERIMSLKTGLNKRTPLWCWLAVAALAIIVLPGAVSKSLPEETAQTAESKDADDAATLASPADQNAASAEMQLLSTEASNSSTIPELPVPQFVRESSDSLVKIVWDAREVSRKRLLLSDQQTPWQVMNGLMAMQEDFVFRDGDKVVNALEWIQSNPQFVGAPWFQKTEHGGQPNPAPAPIYFDDQAQQFFAALAMNDVPLEATFPTADGPITMNAMIRHLLMTVNEKRLSPWTLYALCHYAPLDAKWDNAKGESWSIDRLVQVTMDKPSTALGAIDLLAIAFARNEYLKTGKPLEGVWLEADEKIKGVATRNGDNGTFALKSLASIRFPYLKYEPRQYVFPSASLTERLDLLKAEQKRLELLKFELNRVKRIHVVPHFGDAMKFHSRQSLLFALVAFSDDQLKDERIRQSVESAANDLLLQFNVTDTQPPFHESVMAMSLYLDRVAAMAQDAKTTDKLGGQAVVVKVKGLIQKPGDYEFPANSDSRVLDAVRSAGATEKAANTVFVIRNRRSFRGASIIQLSLDRLERGVDQNIHLVQGDEIVLETDTLFKQSVAEDIHLNDSFVLSADAPIEMSDVVVSVAGRPITVASLLGDSVAAFMVEHIPKMTGKQRRTLTIDTIKNQLPTFVFDDFLRQYFHIEIPKSVLDERAVALAARDEEILKSIREKQQPGVAISDENLKSLAMQIEKLRAAHPATNGILYQTSLHTIVSPYTAGLPKAIAEQETVIRDHCLQLLIHAELRKTITLNLEGVTLQDFLRELSRKNTLNVVLKTSAVESAGLGNPTNAITYHCQNRPFKDAIIAIIEPLGLDLQIEHEALCIQVSDQEKFWGRGRSKDSAPSYCIFGRVKNHGWHVLDTEIRLRDVIELEDASMAPGEIHIAITNPDIRLGKANPVSMSLRLLLDDSTGKLNRVVNDGDIITIMTAEDAAKNVPFSAGAVAPKKEQQIADGHVQLPEVEVQSAGSAPPADVQIALSSGTSKTHEHTARIRRVIGFDSDLIFVSVVEGNLKAIKVSAIKPGRTTFSIEDENKETYTVEVVIKNDVADVKPKATEASVFVLMSYPVADLVAPILRNNEVGGSRPEAPHEAATEESGTVPEKSPVAQPAPPTTERAMSPVYTKEDFAPLVELIKASVEPESWGNKAVISPDVESKSLLIRQTFKAHDEITDLIIKLRKGQTANIQITSLLVKLTTDEQLKVTGEYDGFHSLADGMKWSLLTPKRSETLTKALLDQKPVVISSPRIMTISGQAAHVMVGSTDKSVFSGFSMTVTPQLVPDSSIIRLQHQISIGTDRQLDAANDATISASSFALVAQDQGNAGSVMHESVVGSGQTLLLLIERPRPDDATKSVDRYVLLLTPEHLKEKEEKVHDSGEAETESSVKP